MTAKTHLAFSALLMAVLGRLDALPDLNEIEPLPATK